MILMKGQSNMKILPLTNSKLIKWKLPTLRKSKLLITKTMNQPSHSMRNHIQSSPRIKICQTKKEKKSLSLMTQVKMSDASSKNTPRAYLALRLLPA